MVSMVEPEALLGKIRLGEDAVLKLKTVNFGGNKIAGPSRDELSDEMEVFANSNDGVVVLGVDVELMLTIYSADLPNQGP